MRAEIHGGREHKRSTLHTEAEYIYGQPRLRKAQLMPTDRLPAVIYPVFYGQPRLRKAQLMPTDRLPAVIYPVSSDPDGFRGTIIERSDTASDVSVGFGHSSVRNRFAITSIAFAARQACSCALLRTSTPMIVLTFVLHQRPRHPCALVG